MTKDGIILNNEMADFSIPGVTKIDGAGPPQVSRKDLTFYKYTYPINTKEPCKGIWFALF